MNNEIKNILDKINDLTNWDKEELLEKLISENYSSIQAFFEENAEEYGYVKESDIDPIDEVISNGLQTEVLDTMLEHEIAEYAVENIEIIRYIIHLCDNETLYSCIKDKLLDIIKLAINHD